MSPANPSKTIRIMVIEPDAGRLHFIRDALMRSGYDIYVAPSGWEALKQLRDVPVDLILCAFSLTDMNAFEFRRKCLLHPALRDIPFVFILEESQHEEQRRILESTSDDCITFPIDSHLFVARIYAVVARRHEWFEHTRLDPLTRLLNHHVLAQRLEEEFARCRRYERPLALVLMDLDGLDALNRMRGMHFGDLIITCLAGVIMVNIRNTDIAGRLQGASFMVGLTETTVAGAQAAASRIASQFGTISQSLCEEETSFTAVISPFYPQYTSFEICYERLGLALKAKKELGRGRVYVLEANEIFPR